VTERWNSPFELLEFLPEIVRLLWNSMSYSGIYLKTILPGVENQSTGMLMQIDNGWIKVDSPFPEAIEIVDTKFQMTYRPKGRFEAWQLLWCKD